MVLQYECGLRLGDRVTPITLLSVAVVIECSWPIRLCRGELPQPVSRTAFDQEALDLFGSVNEGVDLPCVVRRRHRSGDAAEDAGGAVGNCFEDEAPNLLTAKISHVH